MTEHPRTPTADSDYDAMMRDIALAEQDDLLRRSIAVRRMASEVCRQARRTLDVVDRSRHVVQK